MFTGVSLKNFKPFGSRQTARLAPLTLIYGPNSSGKSSIIQSILLLKQSLNRQDKQDASAPGEGPLLPSGSHDFGTIRALVHQQKARQSFELGVSFIAPQPSWLPNQDNRDRRTPESVQLAFRVDQEAEGESNPNQHWMTDVRLGLATQSGEIKNIGFKQRRIRNPSSEMEWDNPGKGPLVPTGGFALDMESARALGDCLLEQDDDLRGLLVPFMNLETTEAQDLRNRRAHSLPPNELSNEAISTSREFLAAVLRRAEFRAPNHYMLPVLCDLGDVGLRRSSTEPSLQELSALLDDLISNFLLVKESGFRDVCSEVIHLGPLRFPTSRDLFSITNEWAAEARGRGDVGRLGDRSKQEFYHAPKNKQDRINQWMNKLDLDYQVYVDLLSDITRGSALSLSLRKRGNDPVKRTTGDVGFGVSQILPVIIQGVISEDKTICVEEPEIHLHPRLQARVADFLIDTTKRRRGNNQWIVETHSELIVQRIQRRIREGVISNNDVSVLYVDPVRRSASVIRELRLDSNGEFLDEWPSGFFEESFEELMGFNDLGGSDTLDLIDENQT